jgi:DNA (cytosine-5)-methyltransferase 1
MVEFNSHAANTIRFNAANGITFVGEWPFAHEDVRNIEWKKFCGVTSVVAGGPPCQPFSIGGKSEGNRDSRDMWPEAIRAVREIEPDLFLFENVRGLLRPAFTDYVAWISSYLASPHLIQAADESHATHLERLKRRNSSRRYDVRVIAVNAADYGAAQKRHRVLVIGVKRNLGAEIRFPRPSHSQERLVWDKWITGDYWKRHGIRKPSMSLIPLHEQRVVSRLANSMLPPEQDAWVTCRDAFFGLGEPGPRSKHLNHRLQAGAKSYAGHTGSSLDEPSKALKAGVHGVPGGENMLALECGTVRYFSIREAARGFPDDYQFPGSWSESMRQLGNAVPIPLARFVAYWALTMLKAESTQKAA